MHNTRPPKPLLRLRRNSQVTTKINLITTTQRSNLDFNSQAELHSEQPWSSRHKGSQWANWGGKKESDSLPILQSYQILNTFGPFTNLEKLYKYSHTSLGPLPWSYILSESGGFNLPKGEPLFCPGSTIYALATLHKFITSSILNQMLRFFFPGVRKINANTSASSKYFISQGDRTYSPSKAPATPSTAISLRFWALLWWDQRKRSIHEMSDDSLYF